MSSQAELLNNGEIRVASVTTLRVVDSGRPERDLSAVEVWDRICSARLRIVEERMAEEHLLIALREEQPAAPAVEGRRLRLLELVLQGRTANYAALELEIADSTASLDLKRALLALGLRPRFSTIPVFLSELSNAAQRKELVRARDGFFDAPRPGHMTLLLPRHDHWLVERLSRVELEVCSMLLRGHTHEQIAKARGTAPRTIANQLGSVFGKLGASGRMAVIALLACGHAQKDALSSWDAEAVAANAVQATP
jgi:DNA-binding NarL/FixJ family response regulator